MTAFYGMYYFRSAVHVGKIVNENCIRKPEDATIGDLLKEVGDRCIYNYDLPDLPDLFD